MPEPIRQSMVVNAGASTSGAGAEAPAVPAPSVGAAAGVAEAGPPQEHSSWKFVIPKVKKSVSLPSSSVSVGGEQPTVSTAMIRASRARNIVHNVSLGSSIPSSVRTQSTDRTSTASSASSEGINNTFMLWYNTMISADSAECKIDAVEMNISTMRMDQLEQLSRSRNEHLTAWDPRIFLDPDLTRSRLYGILMVFPSGLKARSIPRPDPIIWMQTIDLDEAQCSLNWWRTVHAGDADKLARSWPTLRNLPLRIYDPSKVPDFAAIGVLTIEEERDVRIEICEIIHSTILGFPNLSDSEREKVAALPPLTSADLGKIIWYA